MGQPHEDRSLLQRLRGWLPLAGMVAVAALFVVGLLLLIGTAFRNSEPYRHGLALAQASPDVTRALGAPVEAGWLTVGSISTSGLSGSANLRIPLHGSIGRGTLYVDAIRIAGEWQYFSIAVEVRESGELITLTALRLP